MNLLSILLLVGIFIWLAAAVAYLVRKKGCGCSGGGCSGDCSSCGKKCR